MDRIGPVIKTSGRIAHHRSRESVIDQTQRCRGGGFNWIAAHDHLQRRRQTDHPWKTPGSVGSRQKAEFHFGQTECCGFTEIIYDAPTGICRSPMMFKP
jgi:hypothetical protein